MNQLAQLKNLALAIAEAEGQSVTPELAQMAKDLAHGGLPPGPNMANPSMTEGEQATIRLFMDQALLCMVIAAGGEVDFPVEVINNQPRGFNLVMIPPAKDDPTNSIKLKAQRKLFQG